MLGRISTRDIGNRIAQQRLRFCPDWTELTFPSAASRGTTINMYKIARMMKKGAEGWADNAIYLTDVVAFIAQH
jgi:hypothetical protein